MKFIDYSSDGIKDILIQNSSDARSNWTFYLYVFDPSTGEIKKIQGFEFIKNPSYVSQFDLIDNLVMSGRNWTSFFKISGDTIIDFDIVLYDTPSENDDSLFDVNYMKAVKEIQSNYH
jgi:hypothetical protein